VISDWNIKGLSEEVVESLLLNATDADGKGTDELFEGWIDWYEEVEDIHRTITSREETHVADGVIGSVIEKSKLLLNEVGETTLPRRLDRMNDTEEKKNLIRSFFKNHLNGQKEKEWLLGTLRDKASEDYAPCVRAETVNDGDWHNSIIWKGEEQVCTMGIEVYEGKLNIVIHDGDEEEPCLIRKYDLAELGKGVSKVTHANI